MKWVWLLVCLGLTMPFASGQGLECALDGQSLRVQKIKEDYWNVFIGEQEFLLLKKGTLNKLVEEARVRQVKVEKLEKDLEAMKTYIAQLEKETAAAARHIEDLRALVENQKSLNEEYRGLNEDLKKLAGLNRFAVVLGAGLADLPNDDYSPLGALGFEYQKWTAQILMGDDYKGFTVGIRLPFGF